MYVREGVCVCMYIWTFDLRIIFRIAIFGQTIISSFIYEYYYCCCIVIIILGKVIWNARYFSQGTENPPMNTVSHSHSHNSNSNPMHVNINRDGTTSTNHSHNNSRSSVLDSLHITIPDDDSSNNPSHDIMFLPQTPFIFEGTLKQLLMYPQHSPHHDRMDAQTQTSQSYRQSPSTTVIDADNQDKKLIEVIHQVGLNKVLLSSAYSDSGSNNSNSNYSNSGLYICKNWKKILSVGRLVFKYDMSLILHICPSAYVG